VAVPEGAPKQGRGLVGRHFDLVRELILDVRLLVLDVSVPEKYYLG
jgi:hypothetical protein